MALRMKPFAIFLVIIYNVLFAYAQTFDVMDFGAAGDGSKDDTQPFIKAWEGACGASSTKAILNIPKGKTFLLNAIILKGPCKSSSIQVELQGNIVAPRKSNWKSEQSLQWLVFAGVDGLTVQGNGQIDGQGADWWKSCVGDCQRPTALSFLGCKNLRVSGLTHINSQNNHISLFGCANATLSGLHIHAPEDSPNTDGIDIAQSSNIFVLNSNIATGDDCIAVVTDCNNINITGVACGPGHGISIGSMGKNGSEGKVEEVHVKSCSFNATQNGVRIKTWQGGRGYARKVTYEDITLVNAGNPIIIDQFYCPHKTCPNKTGAVQISDISYNGVRGTSNSEIAINLSCSQSLACTNIQLDNVNITSAASGKEVRSFCNNAHGRSHDTHPPVDCLAQNIVAEQVAT